MTTDSPTASADPFLGVWDLDPATLDYQHGRPGRRAVYTVEAIPGGLQFSLDAEDADGKAMKFTYGGAIDGRDKPLPEIGAVLVLTKKNDRIIESLLKREGVVVDCWTRELVSENTMRIIQWGRRLDGSPFQNVSIYRRRK